MPHFFSSFSLETLVSSLGYLGIFGLMISNGAISFPSSQILYILTGYLISIGTLSWVPVIVLGSIGNTLGCILLYEIVRRKGIGFALKKNFIPETEVKKLEKVFAHRGVWFLFFGKLIPALKVFVPIAGGVAKTPRPLFAFLMLASSAVWAIGFNFIGYSFGKSSDVFGKYALALALVAIVVVVMVRRKMRDE